MKNLKNFLLAIPLLALPFLPQTSQAQTFEKNGYSKLGLTVRNFNDSDVNDYVEELIGFESAFGQNIAKDVRAELYGSTIFKKVEGESITNSELGVFFDYSPGDFYLGIGPKIAFFSDKYEGDTYTETGYGLAGRIGYQIPLDNNKTALYFEFNYSNLNSKEDGDTFDIGTSGVSIGIKF